MAVVTGSVLNVFGQAGKIGAPGFKEPIVRERIGSNKRRDPEADAQSMRAAHANKLARLVQFAQGCNAAGNGKQPGVRGAGDRNAPPNAF